MSAWKPNPSLEEQTPCEEASTCHFDRFVPIVRRLMHAYFYDPRTPEGQRSEQLCNRNEKAIAEAVMGALDGLEEIVGQQDPGTVARAMWKVIVAAAERFERGFTQHPDSYLGTREKGKEWWLR